MEKYVIYNKLIRDKIPEYIAERGGTSKTHIADGIEYWDKLKEKLVEEAEGFARDETTSELADLQEVIAAIVAFKQFDAKEIEQIRVDKNAKRGAFAKRIILEESASK